MPGIAPDRLAFQRSQLPSHCSRHRLPLLTANGGCGYQRSLHSSATRPSRQAEQLGMGDCCVPCRIGLPSERHRYRLAIGVKEKAKKPSADGDGCGADEQKCAIYQRKHSAGEHRNTVPGMIKRNSTYQPKHCRQQVNPSAADTLHRLGAAILKAAGFFLATVAGEIVLQAFEPEIKALALMLRAFIGL